MPGLRMGRKCYAASGTPIIRTGRAIAVSIISDLMIVPNRNPGEGLMTEEKIKIGPVCSYSLPVVIKRENCPIWERNTSNTLSPSIVTVFIFIDIVPEMDYVVHRVLTSCRNADIVRSTMGIHEMRNPTWIAIGIEEAKRKV